MSKPLVLPAFLKGAARTIRDTPRLNHLITSALRPAINYVQGDRRKALIAHFPRVGGVAATLPNGRTLRMACAEPESIINSIFYEGWMGEEPEVLPLWYELAKEAGVIVDIGAHIGHLSLVAGHANPDARIFSFEPLPRIADLLRRNVSLNGLANIDVRGRALGRQIGRLPFYAMPDGLPSSSSLSKEFMEPSTSGAIEIVVDVSTLDDEGLPTGAMTLMKIDTETTEPDVIAGGASFLRDAAPVIMVEILDNTGGAARLTEELAAAHYEFDAYLLTDTGPVARDSLVADARWRNHLLVPRDHSRLAGMADILSQFGVSCNP